jgi:hypothetical protein|nr:MAG TPA: hypothetical protein [Caudoviricetes sp.]
MIIMKKVETKISTTVEVTVGGKSVNEVLNNISSICHKSIEYSSSKDEGCNTLYEDGELEDYKVDMEDRVATLESALYQILDLLED